MYSIPASHLNTVDILYILLIRGLSFILWDLATLVLLFANYTSIVKLDIFEVIRTQNVLTYEHYFCQLHFIVKLDNFEVIRTQNVLPYEHYFCCLQ